jgi:aminoglycoside phosphotransferase family enzyme/predicted kinase
MEQRILQSLLSSSAYPEPVSSVHLVQTHVSFIFITDEFVYKIKKPVNLGFLDFSTLDRRRFYCTEEVRLNRRLCPDIYLGVAELRETPGGARFYGDGKLIDYAVKMKKLPEEKMLDRLLREGRVTAGDIRRIARTIGEFHRSAERSNEIDSYGSTESIRRNWDENFRQIERVAPMLCGAEDLRIIKNWVEAFLSEHEGALADRVARGFIRDCDGDIHMGNICLSDQVMIFDCIEFNKRFRYSDTAADIAFLLMDLEFHDRPDFSALLLDEYIAITGDTEIGTVLDFYKTYRAVIRGKVAGFKLIDPDIPPDEQRTARDEAVRYFMLAKGYVIRKNFPASLIITCGLMGTGKSSTVAALAFQLGADIISSDAVRKMIAHLPEHARDFSGYGKGIYSAGFNEATYNRLLAGAEASLSEGRTVIVDATFRRKRDRDRFRLLAERMSVPFRIVQTVCPEAIVRERLEERATDPGAISDGRWELFREQADDFEPPSGSEGELVTIDTSRPIGEICDSILRALEVA